MRIIRIIDGLLLTLVSFGQGRFVEWLEKGQPQHIVVYGTSLSSDTCCDAWMHAVFLKQEQVLSVE